MRIKKTSPTTPANGNIENQYGTSQTNAYSEEYSNSTFATKDVATTSANGLMSSADKSKLDTFIEKGSNANGEYYKFPDGTMICTKQVTTTVNMTTAWGTMYEATNIPLGDFSHEFKYTPFVFTQLYNSDGYIEGVHNMSKTSFGTINVGGPTSRQSVYLIIGLFAFGKWK